jgi:hypothetical protein
MFLLDIVLYEHYRASGLGDEGTLSVELAVVELAGVERAGVERAGVELAGGSAGGGGAAQAVTTRMPRSVKAVRESAGASRSVTITSISSTAHTLANAR